jgi:integrase
MSLPNCLLEEGGSVKMEKLEEFQNYLKTQTSLSESSAKFYYWIIKNFLAKFKEVNIENMNVRIKEYPATKFAFKHYLNFLGRQNEANSLIKTRSRPVKREGVYLTQEEILKIVELIPDNTYKIVALLQFLTGARAAEILKLKKEDFKIENDLLKIKLITKGNRERIVFIPEPYNKIILNFIQAKQFDYPFLKGDFNKPLANLVRNNYIYYYNQLKKVVSDLGYENFATHDFRRNFVNRILDKTNDIRIANAMIGHAKMESTLRYLNKKISQEEYIKLIKELLPKTF